MISQDDVSRYRETGWLLVENVLDAAQLAAIRGVIADFIDKARDVPQHTEIYDLEPGHRPGDPKVRRIKTPHKLHRLFWEIAHSPRLVDILQKLLGPAIRLHGSKINMKAPHYGSPVEWHQDWAFYPHTNDDLLAVGVMLDDCTVENGAMMVVPGSHRGPIFDHHADGFFCGAIDPASCRLDFARAVPITGRAGSMSFHHVRAVHGSAQNVSSKPRALLLYEFAAADAWPLMGVPDLAAFDARLVTGEPSIEPRLAPVPVRMPLPPAPNQGSIYENQLTSKRRYFAAKSLAEA
ncbi:MAG: phytanoyl-CoA dioxygenase family protein [Alphaproteobacteria bacterium]|nr:phytanoyl-CoA dioxygenase family protein [Alphaproteobacteria bacterium]